MKIVMAQINPVIGDIGYNVDKMLKLVGKALEKKAHLIVFPELAVIGYPARDLLLRPEIVNRIENALRENILPASSHIGILLGAPVKDPLSERLYNSSLLFYDGSVVGRQDKMLLPNYDVFDESRYFQPAEECRPFIFQGRKLGVTICEDIWNDEDYWNHCRYETDPVKELVARGAEFIINLSASPYHFGKIKQRTDMLSAIARKHQRCVIYVNQVGGNDELIFDGSSLAFDSGGRLIRQCKSFQEDFVILDTELSCGTDLTGSITEDIGYVYNALILGIKDYMFKTGFRKAVIGLSGGIDSSVTAALAVSAIGKENVLGIAMPSRYSSQESIIDARNLARNLGIEIREIPIERVFSSYLDELNKSCDLSQDLAEENLQARIRGNILMFISNREEYLVLSTGNKSEMAVGYSTLYGDMAGGLAVLADVPKTMVYELARHVNCDQEIIPHRILIKPPSAELKPNQVDEDSLPKYEVLDKILKAYIEENRTAAEITAQGYDHSLVQEIIRRLERAEFKRHQSPPGLRVTTKAFGTGRRFPIAWRP
ncbi:MAG: hypothetical protein PWQ96_344 [Clostridia bacterium]|nr:hypothetical protein [Clostridia bacterium]